MTEAKWGLYLSGVGVGLLLASMIKDWSCLIGAIIVAIGFILNIKDDSCKLHSNNKINEVKLPLNLFPIALAIIFIIGMIISLIILMH